MLRVNFASDTLSIDSMWDYKLDNAIAANQTELDLTGNDDVYTKAVITADDVDSIEITLKTQLSGGAACLFQIVTNKALTNGKFILN